MSSNRIHRREFMLRALGACGAPFLASAAYARAAGVTPGLPVDSVEAVRVASGYLGSANVQAAQAIGLAYLRLLQVERNADEIAKAAAGTLELIDMAPTDDSAVALLVDAVRRDFAERRTLDLEGWILSRTETELCTLVLLN